MALTDRNGMIVRIAANIDELKKTLADGTRAISVTTDSMRKLASSLEGASLERQAHNITAAINEIGGVTKLTDAEAARHLKTLDAWVQKAGLIGKQVPADILRTRDALVRVDEVTDKLPAKTIDWKNALTSVAGLMGITFSAGAVIAFGKHVFDSASQIHDMAEKIGISTDAVQGFKFAAEQSGSSLDAVGTAINKLNVNLAGGDKATVKALHDVGLKFSDIRAMKPEDAFLAIADALQKTTDQSIQAASGAHLMGKGFAELLPGIKEGFRAAADGADKMSKATIKSLEAAQDAWGKLSNKVTIYTGEIIANILKNRTFTAQYERDQREHGTQFANDMADIAARAAEHAGKIYAPFKQPPPPEIQKTAEELAAIAAAAKKAAEKAAAYAAVVAEIHAASVPLTVTQKEQVRSLEALGVSVGTIAKYLHLTEAPIGKFNDQLKETAKSIDQIGKMVASIPHNVPLRIVTENFSGAVPMIDVKAVQAASEGVKQIHAATFDEIESRMRKYGVLSQDVLTRNAAVAREQYDSMRASGLFTADELQKAWEKSQAATNAAIGKTGGLFGSLMKDLQQIPQMLIAAFQGGGGGEGAAKGIGSLLGSTMGTHLATSLVKNGGKLFQGALGDIFKSTLPAIGSLIGPLAGALWNHLFGTAGRDAVKDFATSLGGFDALHVKLNELGAEGERLWIQLTQGVGRNNPEQARAAVEAVTAALQKHKDALDATATAATAAGDAQVEATKKAQAAVDEMTGKIKSLTDSIANEAPEEVMGIVEANTRAQIDAMVKQRDAAQAAIDQTTTTAADAAAKAGDVIDAALAAREYHIKVKVDLDGLPGGSSGGSGSFPAFQHGTHGAYPDFGRGTFALLHGRERVVTEAEGRSGAGANNPVDQSVHVSIVIPPGANAADLRAAADDIVANVTDAVRKNGTARARLQQALGVS